MSERRTPISIPELKKECIDILNNIIKLAYQVLSVYHSIEICETTGCPEDVLHAIKMVLDRVSSLVRKVSEETEQVPT